MMVNKDNKNFIFSHLFFIFLMLVSILTLFFINNTSVKAAIVNIGDTENYGYTGNVQTFTAPYTGVYKLRTWGAQGGSTHGFAGGGGGYSEGKVHLNAGDILYIYVGGQGAAASAPGQSLAGGFNGGGSVTGDSTVNHYTTSGGGATHIATVSGLLSTLENQKDKILIVSGGGGGATWQENYNEFSAGARQGPGGSGGGSKGLLYLQTGVNSWTETAWVGSTLIGGTQTAGYAFGQGANANGESGGGGGYYGGRIDTRSGAGGSGYIGNPLLTDKHMTMYATNADFKDTEPTSKTLITTAASETPTDDTPKAGWGYAKVTFLGNNDTTLKILTVSGYEIMPSLRSDKRDYIVFVNENETSLTLNAETNDSKALVSYNSTISITGDTTTETLTVTAEDGTVGIYTLNIYKQIPSDMGGEYAYTGDVQTFTATKGGLYKIETWGAQGGTANDTYIGGYGGYSTGVVKLKKGETVYIYVGQGGTSLHYPEKASAPVSFNGGGYGVAGDDGQHYVGSGGGATHIATSSGLLSTLENNKDSILIVSGGGGAGYYHTANIYGNGGSGGGYIGNTGTTGDSTRTPASGGTQISGGIGIANGSFGKGANQAAGGGGGYYGGGATGGGTGSYQISGAGGGSGYIGSTRLTTTDQITKHMSCYNCATSDDESTKTVSNTCHSSAATADCAKEGDGYARIMFIEEYTSDATLSFLSVTNYELDKKFNSNKYEYSLPTFEETVETIEINATPNDYNATVSGDGIINVPYGKSTHEIIVTAQDGTIGIYKIKLNREATPEDEYSYNYTGDVQEFIAPVTGKYKLETWGAQGGSADNTYVGGYGAYSTGIISLKANQKVYIYVGGEGQTTTNGYSESVAGGYNGGGAANTSITSCSSATQYKSSGGGATHMATTSGLLNTLENNKSNILIVSAGGGGGSLLSDDSCYNQHSKSNGGSGAGYLSKVESFEEIDYQESYTCYSATQNSAGYCTYNGETKGLGSFGIGGSYVIGGGGGYYGGASGTDKKSQGGVSYIGNTKLIDKHMTCYKCETSSEESTKTSSTACFSISPKEDCAKRGNGYAKITPLGIESEDATLKSLTVTDQELKQAFDPERLNYDLILDEGVTSVEINAEANDEKASLTYNQNVELTSNPQLEQIIVTAEDGTINVYSINIKRAKKSYLKKWLDTKFYLIADNQSDSITTLRKATTAEYNAAKDSFNDLNTISLANSPYPTYAWKDNDSILFYSEADIVYMNPDSMQYFTTFKNATSIDLSFFDTSKVTNMSFMFKDLSKLTSLDVSNFDTSKVTNMNCLFSGVSSITSLDVSNFDTSNVTYMNGTFANLKSLNDLDLSNFDTSNVTDMGSMFENAIVLDGIDLSSFDTSNVKNMHNMFYNTKTPKLDLKHFDVSKVNDFGSIFTLTDVDEIDISGWVFNVSSLSSIFYKSKVTKLILDDVDTSSLTTMRSMFSGLLKLKEVDLSSLDTENVTDMSYMFYASDSIETLDLSSFDTRKVTTMENMFTTNNSETALRSINLSSFKVYNVTTMYGMFENAKHLESIDLSSFDVSSVTTMERMFYNCNSLKTVDLSNFNSPQLTNISGMFGSNYNLERIYANESFSTENVAYSNVFKGCAKLVGGMGTMYSLSNINSTYARVDDPENGRPGYFTYKEFKPTIYYPDDTFEEVTFNSLFTFPENWPKENENVSTVTFKYQNGEEDYISNVTKSFDLYRWKVNDNTYSPSSDKNIIADTYLEPIYNETIEGAEFPENPTSEHGTFLGWYTEPTGGERVTSYNREENITLYAHWNYDEMTISFEENGGEEISDITIPYGNEIGELPSTTKPGFILEGWYSDEELTNKVLSNTVVNDDMILYAKWIEDDFPIVFSDDEEVFDGTNYLNTHIKLYNEENISKDYEIGFTIEEFDESIQEQYATFVQDKYELESAGYPGLVVRMNYHNSELKTNIAHRRTEDDRNFIYIDNYPVVKKVRIVRKNNTIYYSVNDGELSVLHNYNNFTNYFETEATFGAALDENNNPYRFLKGKLSNMYIRLGEAQDDHMVTYPDGNVEIYPHNTVITLGTNNSSKASEEGATVTFKYHNDMEDTTSKVIDKYLANGFKVSDTHYDNSSTLLVDSDKIIEYDYDKISSTTFPEDPTKEKFKFDGWYTEEVDGEKVESYDGEDDIILHAHWLKSVATLDDITVNIGELKEEFNKDTTSYTWLIPKGTEAVLNSNVEVTKTDPSSTVSMPERVEYTSDGDTYEIVVTAEDGETTKTYTLTLEHIKSSEARLNHLESDIGFISPEFDKDRNNYLLEVYTDTEVINLTGETIDSAAIVIGLGEITLENEETTHEIEVTAEDGTTNIYSVVIKKNVSTEITVNDIKLYDNDKEIKTNPEFSGNTNNYEASVSNQTERINIVVETNNESQSYKLKLNDSYVENVDLLVGENTLEVEIYDKLNKKINTYIYTITRFDTSNAYLMNIEVEGYELNPEFSKKTYNYTLTVGKEVNEVNIIATTEDEGATITGNGIRNIDYGTNEVEVVVTSINGEVTKTYTIMITRELETDNFLLTLESNVGEFDKSFDKDINEYTLTLPAKTQNIILTGTVSNMAEVTGLGEITIDSYEIAHEIVVTSQSGSVNTYLVNIIKEKSNNTNLINLVPSIGSIEYSNDITEYEMTVDSRIDSIGFEAIPEDADVTIVGIEESTLDYGENIITITVTAEDGITTREITVKVTRKASFTDLEIEEEVKLIKGQTYELHPKGIPTNEDIEVTYTIDNEEIISMENNVVTGLEKGSTTVTVMAVEDPAIEKEITVNVYSDKLESNEYIIEEKEKAKVSIYKDPTPRTTISDYISGYTNEKSLLKVYDKEDNLVEDYTEIIKTGMKVKLEYGNVVYDEVKVIVLGDIDENGLINVTDQTIIQNHIVGISIIDDYRIYAMDLSLDDKINVTDQVEHIKYLISH